MKSILFHLFFVALLSAEYPRIANYFLDYNIRTDELDSLAQCDFLVLDHEVGHSRPEIIDSLRKKNPSIKLLAYVVSQEINDNATDWTGSLRSSLYKGIMDMWWLRDSKGEKLQFWPGTHMLNVALGTPEKSSLQWNRYLATFVCDSILAPGKWDGLYFDNCWHSVSWLNEDMDIDNDGTPDNAHRIDSLWKVGMDLMLDLVRDQYPETILMGNGGYKYGKQLNGVLVETFPQWGEWFRLMDIYWEFDSTTSFSPYTIINANTDNTGEISYKDMRFSLASTLLGDGYFSYDFGADDHSQHWWFDEYSVDLGAPLGKTEKAGGTTLLEEDFSGALTVTPGQWKITTAVLDTLGWNSALKVEATGEEEWNELLKSIDSTTVDSIHLRGEFRVKILSADPGAELYALMRKGSDYDKDISLLSIPIYAGIDTTIRIYSDSLLKESGYRLMIGLRKGGLLLIDDIYCESDEALLYKREFEQGVVYCNPSQREQRITLTGNLSLIKGVQDPLHNTGEKVSDFLLAGRDGVLFKRDLSTIQGSSDSKRGFSLLVKRGVLHMNEAPFPEGRIEVYSLEGKLLKDMKIEKRVPLPGLSSGTYIARILNPKGESVVRRFLLR